MSETIKLKPCPFCGSENIFFEDDVRAKDFWVLCWECKGHTGYFETEEEAVNAWNRRVGE